MAKYLHFKIRDLKMGNRDNFFVRLLKDKAYIVQVDPEKEINFDLYIYDENWEEIAKDNESYDLPTCELENLETGIYRLQVRSEGVTGDSCSYTMNVWEFPLVEKPPDGKWLDLVEEFDTQNNQTDHDVF